MNLRQDVISALDLATISEDREMINACFNSGFMAAVTSPHHGMDQN
jgi:hypothetical protein